MTPELILEDSARNESLLPSCHHKEVAWFTLHSSSAGKEGSRKRSLVFASGRTAQLLSLRKQLKGSTSHLPSLCFWNKAQDLAAL